MTAAFSPLTSTAASSARRPLLLGASLLLLALGLAIAFGLVLMGFEDGGGRWDDPAALARWRAALSPALRVAYWVAAVGSPLAAVAGGVLVLSGLRRALEARARTRLSAEA